MPLPENHKDSGTISKCVAISKEHYAQHWADHTRPYPGISELLDAVEKRNMAMTVLSNKPDEFTQVMVKKLLPERGFKIVRGVSPSVRKKPDPAGTLQIAGELSIPPERFLYLGDTNTDMQTANAAGMYAVGALWGFRTADELIANGAKVLVKTPLDVLEIIEGI